MWQIDIKLQCLNINQQNHSNAAQTISLPSPDRDAVLKALHWKQLRSEGLQADCLALSCWRLQDNSRPLSLRISHLHSPTFFPVSLWLTAPVLCRFLSPTHVGCSNTPAQLLWSWNIKLYFFTLRCKHNAHQPNRNHSSHTQRNLVLVLFSFTFFLKLWLRDD